MGCFCIKKQSHTSVFGYDKGLRRSYISWPTTAVNPFTTIHTSLLPARKNMLKMYFLGLYNARLVASLIHGVLTLLHVYTRNLDLQCPTCPVKFGCHRPYEFVDNCLFVWFGQQITQPALSQNCWKSCLQRTKNTRDVHCVKYSFHYSSKQHGFPHSRIADHNHFDFHLLAELTSMLLPVWACTGCADWPGVSPFHMDNFFPLDNL